MIGRARRRAALAVALWIVVGALVALAGRRYGDRLDLTRDGRHSLAPVTLERLGALTAPVEARAFLPSAAPPPFDRVAAATRDVLEDMVDASDGRVRLVVRDPTDPDLAPDERAALEAEAERLGLRPVALQALDADRRVVQQTVMGVVWLAGDRVAVARAAERVADVEHGLVRALDALRGARTQPVIGVTTGHGEPPVLDGPLADVLGTAGRLEAITLAPDRVPPHVDLLLMVAPRRPLEPRARFVLDQFLLEGKALVVVADFVDRSPLFPDVLVPVATGLEPVLAAAGLDLAADRLVLDRAHPAPAIVGLDAAGRPARADHPLFPVATNLAEHPVTAGLRTLVVPLAVPIDASRAIAAGHAVSPLVRTAPSSVARRGLRSFDPAAARAPAPADELPGPHTVAIALRGSWDSAFADADIPPRPADAPLDARTGAPDPPPLRRAVGPARVVLVTSGARFLAAHTDALLMLQNAVDWALDDAELTALRGRRADDPPLDATDASTRLWVRLGNIAGPPLLCLLWALIRLGRRRRRDRR